MNLKQVFTLLLSLYVTVEVISKQMFFMLSGKRLIAPIMQTQTNVSREICLGLCFTHDDCKAFNWYKEFNDLVCELFQTDRCGMGTKLIDYIATHYFDKIIGRMCMGKKCLYLHMYFSECCRYKVGYELS